MSLGNHLAREMSGENLEETDKLCKEEIVNTNVQGIFSDRKLNSNCISSTISLKKQERWRDHHHEHWTFDEEPNGEEF